MPAILFHCPNVQVKVQGWIADDPDLEDGENFEPVICAACTRTHMINPKSGKVLGQAHKS